MKKTFILLWALLLSLNSIHAEEEFRYENTSWNVIRDRLFDGSNSKVLRFNEDVRFQLKNANHADSLIIQEIIDTLNPIIKIIELKLTHEKGNFILNFDHEAGGYGSNTKMRHENDRISSIKLTIINPQNTDYEKKRQQLYFHVFRHLIEIKSKLIPRTRYNGVFDSNTAQESSLHEIDLDIVKKVYSSDFSLRLKDYTIKKHGIIGHIQLRHGSLFKILSIIFGVVFTILLFAYLLLQSKSFFINFSLKNYLKKGLILLTALFTFTTFYSISVVPTFIGLTIVGLIFKSIIWIYATGIVAITLIYFAERLLNVRKQKILPKIIIVFFTTFTSIMVTYSIFFVLGKLMMTILLTEEYLYALRSFHAPIIYIAVTISLFRTLFIYLLYQNQSMINQKDVELAKMTSLKNQAELQALHSRINPHFLYNSLNSIASLAESEPKKVQKMSMALSDLFRYAVNKNNDHIVTVEQELQMVEKYLEVEQVRFGDQFSYSFDVDESAKAIPIPKFLIQPLVENAVKHGISKITKKGILRICIQQNNKNLNIEVHDNGPDFPEDLVSGYGLQNLHDKLEILYKDKAKISWENGENKHIRVTLKNQF